MVDLKTLMDLMVKGAGAAREAAEQAVATLVERGDVSREEAAEIQKEVLEAIETNRAFLEENVVSPLRALAAGIASALGGADARDAERREILAKLAELSDKIDRLERGAPTRTKAAPKPRRDKPTGKA
ncbi:MAG: hypothetical protein KC466_07155 [Myxococcales bacterium]|nr:hypothetical protein [Myxococcales bacterium]